VPISKQNAVIRARKGAIARNSPDTYIRSLERAADELTAKQKRDLTALALSFLAEPAEPGGAEAGDAA
jgi:hypothetical protein